MTTNHLIILHILVADGDPDGLRVVERSNWNGKVVKRARFTSIGNRAAPVRWKLSYFAST